MMETTFSLFMTSRLGMKPVFVGLSYGAGALT